MSGIEEIPNPETISKPKIQMAQSVTRSLRVPICRDEAISVEGGGYVHKCSGGVYPHLTV